MNFLAFETSTSRASVAVQNSAGKRSFRSSDNPKSHSEFLNQAIQECLDECQIPLADINRILTTNGPGSFTGIRVALSAAKSIAYSLGLGVKSTNSLFALHHATNFQNQIALLNAQKDMVFVSLRILGKTWENPMLVRISEIEKLVLNNFDSKVKIEPLGHGFIDYSEFWSEGLLSRFTSRTPDHLYPSANTLIDISLRAHEALKTFEWKSLNPLYLRASAAEEKEAEKLK